MNERHERIERLVERWLEARTTEAEERELRELLRREEELPESLCDMALLFEGFEALSDERMPDGEATGRTVSKAADALLDSSLEPSGLPPELAAAGSAAVGRDFPSSRTVSDTADAPTVPTAAAPTASAGGRILSVRPASRSGRRMRLLWGTVAAAVVAVGLFLSVELLREPYCYIDGKPVYDREVAMQTTAYLDSFALLEMPDQLVDELIDKP